MENKKNRLQIVFHFPKQKQQKQLNYVACAPMGEAQKLMKNDKINAFCASQQN